MADKINKCDSKENTCPICYEKSKFKLCEDIEKDLIMNLKPQSQNNTQDLIECRNANGNEHCVYKEIVTRVDETAPKKKKTKKHQEIQSLKELVAEQLQNILKVVTGFEKTVSSYTKKYEQMITMLEDKLDRIQKLETQNSWLRHDLDQLSQRLNFVEQNCIHVKTERNYNKLGQQLNVDFPTPAPRLSTMEPALNDSVDDLQRRLDNLRI